MMVTAKFEGAVWQGANAGRSERFFGPVQPRDSVVPTVVYSMGIRSRGSSALPVSTF